MFSLFKREKRSIVAGILEKTGGIRVVVTQKRNMKFHIQRGERLFILPDLFVEEPVPWNEIPNIIELVKKHVEEKIT